MRHAMLIATLLLAMPARASDVVISESWARATAPGQSNSAVYLTITSHQDARIVALSSLIAGSASLHSMTQEDGVMKMRELDALPLPSGKIVKLSPGGYHIMLDSLKQSLEAGDSVPLSLTIKYADQHQEKIEIKVKVQSLSPNPNEQHHKH